MMGHLAAVAATATLLVTALPAAAAGTAEQASCAKRVLKLPADSLPGSSAARTGDSTGRYILGEANRDGRMHPHALLWVNGVPRWLSSQSEGESFAYSVTDDGHVLGSTSSADGTDHWIYSAKTNKYRSLEAPAGFRFGRLTAMNANLDIAGTAVDEATGESVALVWPAGGQPQLLPVPSGLTVFAVDDISDESLIIGRVDSPDAPRTSYLWKSWSAEPTRLPGLDDDGVWARDIEGRWIAGGQDGIDDATGLLWNTRTSRVVELEDSVADLNSSRDAVTAGRFGPLGDWPSVIIRSDGTKVTFPAGTLLSHIFERNAKWTAAGFDVSSGTLVPVVYACR
ncbi:hypothetical protein [Kribbella speibonae]|uniref:WD40 repeat domain-containing protein n=1 Tax=Kribbella speibonae TaxID=1572660 RepID=A0A4R0IT13_9ACTN|nr:hypothetical protein [Kribbella speibonae]TCC36217.1 hypothetical protein E0H92_26515 [Kribbella speibonae]